MKYNNKPMNDLAQDNIFEQVIKMQVIIMSFKQLRAKKYPWINKLFIV